MPSCYIVHIHECPHRTPSSRSLARSTYESFLPDETNVGTLAPALENAILDASDGEGASKLNFTRLNENIGALSEVSVDTLSRSLLGARIWGCTA